MNKTIGIITGSLRKNSSSGIISNYVKNNTPEGYSVVQIDIADLPIYNQDYDGEEIKVYTDFRSKIKAVDAILFVTPEHNRSIPAALKNAIDVGSRPYGANVWNGKPAAIISQSTGKMGGFGANHHLRQSLVHLNMYVMAQPEVYLSSIRTMIDDGAINNESTKKFIDKFLAAFVEWIEKIA